MKEDPTLDSLENERMILPEDGSDAEDPEYLARQLITYIGNKRALLGYIGNAVEKVKSRLGKDKIRVFDAFSGSGVVSRYLKANSSMLISNDIEDYSAVIGRCYLRNRSTIDWSLVREAVADLNRRVGTEQMPPGFIEELYAPKDCENIIKEDRVFYTRENARRLDNYRRLIESTPHDIKDLLMGPLLSEASVHANTAGVFKGFYKNRHTGIGQFGGTGNDALSRILGKIELEAPVLSRFECDYEVLQQDANEVACKLKDLDLAYIDPPYNQHPYGSNYFMLNLIVKYQRPERISRVSGIPVDWRRSGYNVRQRAPELLQRLLESIAAPFLLVSYNNEGFIRPEEMNEMLSALGAVEAIQAPYNAFRGSRNFDNRPLSVTEYLFLVERK